MIDNETFLAAWEDPDNRRLMASISRGFPLVPREERREVQEMALVRCLGSYDPGHGARFTTSLARFLTWDFLAATRKIRRRRARGPEISLEDVPEPCYRPHDRQDDVDHVMERLSEVWPGGREVIRQHFFGGMTTREIGVANGCSRELARQKLNRAVDRLRSACRCI